MAKTGRPSGLTPERKELALKIYGMFGATDGQLAELFSVTEQTVNNWKIQDPQFFESLKKAKAQADLNVERSLYQRATGYSCPETVVANFQGVITDTKEITKHYPPDTTACIFWLKNRQKEVYRDRPEQGISEGQSITITVNDASTPDKDRNEID